MGDANRTHYALLITHNEKKEALFMAGKISLSNIYIPSEDVVARDIQGEFIIVPIASGIGDLEDEIFTLNETGRAVWSKLDGKKSLKDIVDALIEEFDGKVEEIEKDALGLVEELVKRKMIIEVKK
jgi:hypothetical protein